MRADAYVYALLNGFRIADKSSSHLDMRTQDLDWLDAFPGPRCSIVRAILDEAAPEVILGADVVSHDVFISSDRARPNNAGVRPDPHTGSGRNFADGPCLS